MKKKRVLKWIGIALIAVIFILVIGAVTFYFLELKPRIDVAVAIARAFEDFDDCDVLEFDLDDGQQILLDITGEQSLSGVVYAEDKAYSGLEFGYNDAGIWINMPDVSEKYYLLPWSDDIYDMLDDGALAELLNLSDDQKEEVADTLISLREELMTEETFDFTPTFLNRILGLTSLKADILELYKQIDFSDEGKQSITLEGESITCRKYTANVSREYVKRLLKTDGAGDILNALGDVLGDVYAEAYVCDGELIYMNIETSFLYMPGFDIATILSGDISAQNISFSPASLCGEIYFKDDGRMDIHAELEGDYILDASFLLSASEAEITWGFEKENELNIFEAGYIRLLLELAKWEEYGNLD